MPAQGIDFSIADKTSNAAELATFFRSNLTDDYISHSELQGYRAIAPQKWTANISAVLESEITNRLGSSCQHFPTDAYWQGVVLGRNRSTLVALALITLSRNAAVPFGIIEDVVVDANLRGNGYGRAIMHWIMDRFRDAGIRRAFLESGLNNKSAHHLFERLGFDAISIVMMREL